MARTKVPTERQLELLRFIDGFARARGYAPSRVEMGDGIGCTYGHTLDGMVESLQAKGLIARVHGQPRTVHLTPAGRRWTSEVEPIVRFIIALRRCEGHWRVRIFAYGDDEPIAAGEAPLLVEAFSRAGYNLAEHLQTKLLV